MGKNILFYNSLKSINSYIWIILLLLFTLGSCSSIDVKEKPDLLPYMKKPVVLLSINSPKNLKLVWPDLMEKMEQKLRKIPALGKITGIKELNNKLNLKPRLRSAYKKYISSLTLTGISDKEIALKLEDEFKSPHFLLFDFVSFPCTKECPSDEQWVIRFKLIQAKTGDIIFRVRLAHKLEEEEQNTDLYKALADKLISDVLSKFQVAFIVPWHKLRYENLKKISVTNPQGEFGI